MLRDEEGRSRRRLTAYGSGTGEVQKGFIGIMDVKVVVGERGLRARDWNGS